MTNSTTTWQDMDTFKAALKTAGFKATPQRIAIHEAMMSMGHASADDVFRHIDSNPSASRITVASVYNFLSQMVDAGIYGLRLNPGNKMCFDVNPTPHMHLYDMKSGSFMDISDEEIVESVREHFSHRRFKGYKIKDIDITVSCLPTRK